MTTAVSTLRGRPLWYELMTTDTSAAERFYRNVIGWTSAPFEGSPNPYTVFKRSGDQQAAGLMKTPEGMHMPPFWSMYVGVPNLEEAVTDIKRRGGSELSEVIDVPTVGRLRMMKDPQGAAFYIIQPSSTEDRPENAPEVGEASWHELMTTDAPAAMQFYREIFGWTPGDVMEMGPQGKYYIFNRPRGMIGGMMNTPPELANVPPHWGIYFRVPDIDAAVERIKVNGGKILNGPMEVPDGDRIVNAMDPQGAAFSLHERKRA